MCISPPVRVAHCQWVATGLTAGLIYLPRTPRLAIGTLAALAGSDLLQYTHAWLQQKTS